MGANQNNGGQAAQGDTATIGVGNPSSGEAGATPAHETMAETGGSGGGGMTRNDAEDDSVDAALPKVAREAVRNAMDEEKKPPGGARADQAALEGVVTDSGARGFQDTRSAQAGGSGTGLGTPETGANQTPEDLEGRR
jgi:hypothetical protein